MTHHPATHPLIVRFAHAADPAERAMLVLQMPHRLLREFRMLFRAALAERPSPPVSDYLQWLDVHDSAVRDAFGRAPVWLDEQLTAARLTLCIEAGSVRIENTDRQGDAGEPRSPDPPG